MQRNQRHQLRINLRQPLRRLLLLIQSDRPCRQMHQFRHARIAVHLDHTVPCELCAAIDSEDPHGRSLLHPVHTSSTGKMGSSACERLEFPPAANSPSHTASSASAQPETPAAPPAPHAASPRHQQRVFACAIAVFINTASNPSLHRHRRIGSRSHARIHNQRNLCNQFAQNPQIRQVLQSQPAPDRRAQRHHRRRADIDQPLRKHNLIQRYTAAP